MILAPSKSNLCAFLFAVSSIRFYLLSSLVDIKNVFYLNIVFTVNFSQELLKLIYYFDWQEQINKDLEQQHKIHFSKNKFSIVIVGPINLLKECKPIKIGSSLINCSNKLKRYSLNFHFWPLPKWRVKSIIWNEHISFYFQLY